MYFRSIVPVVEFKFKYSNINKGIKYFIVKMRKQKLPQFAEFFYYYFSCYIKVLDEQHNNISLFKIDCNYQPTDEISLVKIYNGFRFE